MAQCFTFGGEKQIDNEEIQHKIRRNIFLSQTFS